jgi:AraC-like DNA-binding protein
MDSAITAGVRPGGRAQAWNAIYSGFLAAADFIPFDDDFSAGLAMSHVGPLGLARLATGPCAINRTAEHIDRSLPQLYSIIIQARGRGLFSQEGNRVVLGPGDLALCDHALPHSRVLERDAEMLLIRVPAEMIAEYLPQPQHLCGRRLPAGAGLAPSAAIMARALWQRLEQGFAPEYEDCFAHHLLELIGTSYAMAFGRHSEGLAPDADSLLLIRSHIDDRLYDPGFKAGAIGAELGFGGREVRRLCAAGGENPRDYMLRRRLQEAARRLRDLRWQGHTIAEIAHCCGFASNAVFTRAFRERHGLSPTEYRAQRPVRDRGLRRPVSISFDRTGASATLDRGSAGIS